MQPVFNRLFYTFIVFLMTAIPVFGFGGGGMATTDPAAPMITPKMKELTIPVRQEGSKEILQVPLFSEKYAALPIASVDGEPITLKEFALELATMHNTMSTAETPGSQSFSKLLERLISIKLVRQEALNIGFDRTPGVQKQIADFSLKTMMKQLLAGQIRDLQVPVADVEELYQQMAIEVKLLTYSFANKDDADTLLSDFHAGGNFKQLADKMVASGKAKGDEELQYSKLNDLFPAVSKAVYSMNTGDVSEVFKGKKDYYLFRLEDRQVYEDPDVRLAAANRLMQQLSQKKQYAYLDSLVEKYVTYDEDAKAALDFARIAEENPGIKGTEVFSRFTNDKRPLATVTVGQKTVVLSVADISKKVEATMYHGADRVIDGESLNREKENVLWNELVAISGKMEAQAQGFDQTPEFLEKVRDFEDRVLFDTFMAKAVIPEVKVPEDDVKKYYYNHLDDYSSPLMLTMKSLVFSEEPAAREAFKKLQAGSDFKWVSANSTGLAAPDNKDLLNFAGTLLAVTALPEDLQKQLVQARPGDMFFYSGPGGLYYNLLIETAFAPKAKDYQEVRQAVGKIIYGQKINEALADWVSKLKDAYETKIFIVQDKS